MSPTLFNHLTGYANGNGYRKILVAPGTLRARLLELIREEADAPDGRIVMKMNSLVDPQIIDALYDASAGGDRDRPDRARHLLPAAGRRRAFGAHPRALDRRPLPRALAHLPVRQRRTGRALLHRLGRPDAANLDGRVECVAPVTDPALTQRLEEILAVNLADDVLAWELGPEGWSKVATKAGVNAHVHLQALAEARDRRQQPRERGSDL